MRRGVSELERDPVEQMYEGCPQVHAKSWPRSFEQDDNAFAQMM